MENAVELLWKFLKGHLKLDRLATKSVNGVTIQIYMVLIVYLILLLIEIPKVYGEKLIDKLRYIHMGLKAFLVTDAGEEVAIPQHYRKAEKQLKRIQPSLSRKKKGSNRRKKAIKRVAKAHLKVSTSAKTFTTRRLKGF